MAVIIFIIFLGVLGYVSTAMVNFFAPRINGLLKFGAVAFFCYVLFEICLLISVGLLEYWG